MVLPLWRSMHSLNLMLPKEDRKAMLLRLYNEDTPLQDHSKDRFHSGGAKQKVRAEPNEDDEDAESKAKSEVKDELNIKAEGEEDDLSPAGLDDEDIGVNEEVREDDLLPDNVMKELKNGV